MRLYICKDELNLCIGYATSRNYSNNSILSFYENFNIMYLIIKEKQDSPLWQIY